MSDREEDRPKEERGPEPRKAEEPVPAKKIVFKIVPADPKAGGLSFEDVADK